MKAIKRDGEVVAYLNTSRVVAIHPYLGKPDESAVFLGDGAAVKFRGSVVDVAKLLGLATKDGTPQLMPTREDAIQEMLGNLGAQHHGDAMAGGSADYSEDYHRGASDALFSALGRIATNRMDIAAEKSLDVFPREVGP